MYLSLHCHHRNDSCIKMGSDESHFNVSLIVKDKVTRQCPLTVNPPRSLVVNSPTEQYIIKPFTAPACKISGPKDAGTSLSGRQAHNTVQHWHT